MMHCGRLNQLQQVSSRNIVGTLKPDDVLMNLVDGNYTYRSMTEIPSTLEEISKKVLFLNPKIIKQSLAPTLTISSKISRTKKKRSRIKSEN